MNNKQLILKISVCLVVLTALWCGMCVCPSNAHAKSQTTKSASTVFAPQLPISVGRLVLRLPYHLFQRHIQGVPYRAALFEDEMHVGIGRLVAADWQGNFYFYDPTTFGSGMLRCYDKLGKLHESWGPLSIGNVDYMATTKDGHLWIGAREEGFGLGGLPVIMCRQGQKDKTKPLLDWRRKMPNFILSRLAVVAPQFDFTKQWNWGLNFTESAGDKMLLSFTGEDVKSSLGNGSNRIRTRLELLLSSNGKELLDLRISDPLQKQLLPRFSPNGKVWQYDTDLNMNTWKVHKLWLWEDGKEKGAPFIDLQAKEPKWLEVLKLDANQITPAVYFDTQSHFYLLWQRESKSPAKRFVVEGKSRMRDPITMGEGEKALVVLDKTRKPIAYLPWTTTYWEQADNWIKPVPDGSGFYRIQFEEKEARVYFHALPNAVPAKAATPHKAPAKSRRKNSGSATISISAPTYSLPQHKNTSARRRAERL